MSLTDQVLIQRVQTGDAHAFEALFDRYCPAIRAYLLKIVKSDAAADDLTQEVFLRVWTHACQWSEKGAFKAWLYQIATHQAFNFLRSSNRHPQLPLTDPDELPAEEDEEYAFQSWIVDSSALEPDAAAEQAERQRQLWGLIEQLPEEKREVFNLVARMEMSIRSAAEKLGIPEGTVKSRLHYARTWLSQGWQDLEGE